MDEFNERFVMIPISLLEIPEFVRFFDSKPIGSIYRVLSSKVWRVPKEGLRKNANKRLTMLTEMYEDGFLVSMHTLSTLAESVGYDERSVRREINSLEELGLIKIIKIGHDVFYLVGETGLKAKDGHSMGVFTEAFYLNRWRDFVNYANEYASDKLVLFREDLAHYFKFGQICHNFLTNLSQISTIAELRNFVRDAANKLESGPLIDKVIDNNKNLMDEGQKSEQKDTPKPETRDGLIKEISDIPTKDAIKFARDCLSKGKLTLAEIRSGLQSHVPKEYTHLHRFPMVAIRLYEIKHASQSDNIKVFNLWTSLREDITGVFIPSNSSGEYSKLHGIIRNLLKKYPYEQIYWTFMKLLSGDFEKASFSVNSLGAFTYVIKSMSQEYHALKEAQLRSEKARAKVEEQVKEMREEIIDDATDDYGDTNSGRLLDALMGWSNDGK